MIDDGVGQDHYHGAGDTGLSGNAILTKYGLLNMIQYYQSIRQK